MPKMLEYDLWYYNVCTIEFRSDDVTNDFAEIMSFIRLFGTTYLKKVHTQNNNCWLFSA